MKKISEKLLDEILNNTIFSCSNIDYEATKRHLRQLLILKKTKKTSLEKARDARFKLDALKMTKGEILCYVSSAFDLYEKAIKELQCS